METSKKIVILILFFLLTFSCKKNNYKNIKNDLYSRNDSLFLLQKNKWHEDREYVIERFDSEVILSDKSYQLKQIVDTRTFEKNNRYYYDENNIYFHNSSPAFFPTLNAIPSQTKELTQFGYDYVSTGNKVYFQSNEIKNADCKTFKVTNKTKGGYYYAYDRHNFYYKNFIITDKDILERLNNEIR